MQESLELTRPTFMGPKIIKEILGNWLLKKASQKEKKEPRGTLLVLYGFFFCYYFLCSSEIKNVARGSLVA